MGKVKAYVNEFPSEFTAAPKNELFCSLCCAIVGHERRPSILKHRESSKHSKAQSEKASKQSVLTVETSTKREEFVDNVVTRDARISDRLSDPIG